MHVYGYLDFNFYLKYDNKILSIKSILILTLLYFLESSTNNIRIYWTFKLGRIYFNIIQCTYSSTKYWLSFIQTNKFYRYTFSICRFSLYRNCKLIIRQYTQSSNLSYFKGFMVTRGRRKKENYYWKNIQYYWWNFGNILSNLV